MSESIVTENSNNITGNNKTIMDTITSHQHLGIKTSRTELNIDDGEGGIPVITIINPHATARISMQGAHVLSWIPNAEQDVIWLSEDAVFAPGKSLRGGVPVCWPWFGPHETNPDYPAHGFARTSMWMVEQTEELEDGSTRIYFTLEPDENTSAMWPDGITVNYIISIGQKLEFELITHNLGSEAVTIGQALHTYFNVGDVTRTAVVGLEELEYIDKTDNFARKQQHGPVTIDREVDRIYFKSDNGCVIEDVEMKRKIVINKTGSHSTVVWNPWEQVAQKMGDLGPDGYMHMLCVESANAADDVVVIQPDGAHHLWVQYKVTH